MRYVGPVDGHADTWLGIEWDDPTRGKHDGATGGRRYFTCSSSTSAASFVRPKKLTPHTSLAAAIVQRYAWSPDADHAESAVVNTAGGRTRPIEVVGAQKVGTRQSVLENLHVIGVVGCPVRTAEDVPGQLAELVPNVQECDASGTCVDRWESVFGMVAALPSLASLNLSDTRPGSFEEARRKKKEEDGERGVISHDGDDDDDQSDTHHHHHVNPVSSSSSPSSTWYASRNLPHLTTLVLNRAGLEDWHPLLQRLSGLTGLKELHLAGNRLGSSLGVAPKDALLLPEWSQRLEILVLDDNDVASWSDVVAAVGSWPRLDRLSCSGNPRIGRTGGGLTASTSETAATATTATTATATTSSPTTPNPVPAFFPALSTLFLGDCGLMWWRDVDILHNFPALVSTRLSNNPLFATARGGGRFEVIARVGRLTSLNGSEVRPAERRDAEIRYLRMVMTDMVAGSKHHPDHPRLAELLGIYGHQVPGADPGSLGSANPNSTPSTLTLHLTCVAVSASATMGSHTKVLPSHLTLGQLRALCQQLFKVPVATMQLYMRTDPETMPELLAGDESRALTWHGVTDGAGLLVDEIDAEAERRKRVREEREGMLLQAEREAAQLMQGDQLQQAGRATLGI